MLVVVLVVVLMVMLAVVLVVMLVLMFVVVLVVVLVVVVVAPSTWSCIQVELAVCSHRSEYLYRERFNLGAADRKLVAGDPAAPGAPAPVGGPFALPGGTT
jgi:hypothetical protein